MAVIQQARGRWFSFRIAKATGHPAVGGVFPEDLEEAAEMLAEKQSNSYNEKDN